MRYRFLIVILFLALLFAVPNVSRAQVEDFSAKYIDTYVYSDSKADISFNIPENWNQEPLTAEREVVKAKFSSPDKTALIIYGSYDVWSQLNASEKQGLTRSSIDNNYVSIDDLAEIYSIPKSSITLESFADNEYYLFPFSMSIDSTNVSIETSSLQALCFYDGFMFQFQFYGEKTGKNYEDFLSLLSSAIFPNEGHDTSSVPRTTNSLQNNYTVDFGDVVLSLVITITLYSMPIMIYRYAIRKQACDKRTAKKITIIYAIIMFFAVSLLYFIMNTDKTASVSAVVLWSYVNYRLLIGGKNPEANAASSESSGKLSNSIVSSSEEESDKTHLSSGVLSFDNNDQQELMEFKALSKHSNTDESETLQIFNTSANDSDDTEMSRSEPEDQRVKTFCHMCGVQLPNHAKFCNRCGVKL